MSPDKIIELLEMVLEEVRVLRQEMSSDGLRHLAARQKFRVPDTPARIITALAGSPLVTRDALSILLYSHKNEPASRNTIDVFINTVRKALRPYNIEIVTIHGRGWCVPEHHREKLGRILEQ